MSDRDVDTDPACAPRDLDPRDLDLRGLACPMPVLKTARALRDLEAGARLVVLASDPLAGLDIPHFCREEGHVLEERAELEGALRFVIRKGGSAPA